jgi:hypothetical protein
MPIVSGGGGGSFNGGTITNALVVDQGFGAEGDFQEGSAFLFDKLNRSWAELASNGVIAYVDIVQDSTGGTANQPIRYRDIAGAHPFLFYIDFSGAIVTRSTRQPTAGELANSSLAITLDATVGATRALLKAKDSNGNVVSAAIALA